MMQNSHPSLHWQPLPHHHHVVFISGTREQWHPLAVIEVSPGPEVFSQIFTSKNEIDKTTFAFGEATYMLFIFRTALSDFLVSKLDFTWPWTGFHISIQILFLVFRPFCVSPNICLTKWTTKIISKKRTSLRSLWHYTWMTPQKRRTIWKPRRSGPILPFHWGKRRLRTYLPQP